MTRGRRADLEPGRAARVARATVGDEELVGALGVLGLAQVAGLTRCIPASFVEQMHARALRGRAGRDAELRAELDQALALVLRAILRDQQGRAA